MIAWRQRLVCAVLAASPFVPTEALAGEQELRARLGPSFACHAEVSSTEKAICGDVELSAYDRAMAFAYERKWRPQWATRSGQRDWLAKRNSCAAKTRCILDLYREWFDQLDPGFSIGRPLQRVEGPPGNADDLLLGTLQSPTGVVEPLGDSANLDVHALGEGWYLFAATAAHTYDSHDGLGVSASTSEAVGVVHLANGKGRWMRDPDDPASCSIDFARESTVEWQLVELAGCSGLGSTLTGLFRRQ